MPDSLYQNQKKKTKTQRYIDTTTVMENNSHQKTLWKVYPNPANDKVTIEIIDHQEALKYSTFASKYKWPNCFESAKT